MELHKFQSVYSALPSINCLLGLAKKNAQTHELCPSDSFCHCHHHLLSAFETLESLPRVEAMDGSLVPSRKNVLRVDVALKT